MLIPSLHRSSDRAQSWSVARAAALGAVIGACAGLFKALGPLHAPGTQASNLAEIVGAALGFALLCVVAAALRNAIARWFIGREYQ